MIKRISLLIATTVILSGCITSTIYDLADLNTGISFPVKIEDKRNEIIQSSKQKKALITIGDKHVLPSPIYVISKKLNLYLKPTAAKQISKIELNHFELIIYWPNMAAIGSGAAMSGVSYSLGIITEELNRPNSYTQDGVISRISLSFDDTEYKCDAYIPASEEIRALVGMQMTSKKMPKPLDDVIGRCVENIVNQTYYDRYR